MVHLQKLSNRLAPPHNKNAITTTWRCQLENHRNHLATTLCIQAEDVHTLVLLCCVYTLIDFCPLLCVTFCANIFIAILLLHYINDD